MPLVAVSQHGAPDAHRNAIGFLMQAGDGRALRVFVTCEALCTLDPAQPAGLHAALAVFDAHRARIETAASRKFDAAGPDEGLDLGQPVLVVHAVDISS